MFVKTNRRKITRYSNIQNCLGAQTCFDKVYCFSKHLSENSLGYTKVDKKCGSQIGGRDRLYSTSFVQRLDRLMNCTDLLMTAKYTTVPCTIRWL